MPPIPTSEPKTYWQTTDGRTVRLYHGHVVDVLRRLPARSVQCVVTSPPYWGLRDYGTGTWTGGDPGCTHEPPDEWVQSQFRAADTANVSGGTVAAGAKRKWLNKDGSCRCGATRTDRQIGSEPSPDCGTHGQAQCGRCFVCTMVGVFREVRRVLRDDGTLWLNLGDTYSGGSGGAATNSAKQKSNHGTMIPPRNGWDKLPGGNLVGVPWRVALALQADGWVLRQDIIWAKPSPMPESVRNRCTKAHEYVFLLTKGMGYYCDMEAVKERAPTETARTPHVKGVGLAPGHPEHLGLDGYSPSSGRNKRSVWTVSSQGYEGAHFATFPPRLIEPMIKAGTSERGCCARCGAPWRRVVEERQLKRERPNDYVKRTGAEGTGNSCANSVAGVEVKTVGWEPGCECTGQFVKGVGKRLKHLRDAHSTKSGTTGQPGVDSNVRSISSKAWADWRAADHPEEDYEDVPILEYISSLPLDRHPIKPCTVLDPFIGSGTTAAVCLDLGRCCVGVDLSEKYLRENAVPRIEGVLLSRPELQRLAGRVAKRVTVGEIC